ncbi:MAG: TraR/DksA family transcriptional regulator [Blastocatellia bacterium]
MKTNKINKEREGREVRQPVNGEEVLIHLRRDVLSALAALEHGPFSDEAEEARREEEIAAGDAIMEVEHRYRQGLVERLHRIEEAFERLAVGTYGLCAVCGNEISRKRLEADPSVGLCLLCQELAERSEVPVPAAVI